MISSVTVTKFDTVRIVAVGVCALPIELQAHIKAALSTDFQIKYLIAPSLGFSDQLAWFVVFGSLFCRRRDSRAILGADRASLPDRVQWARDHARTSMFPAHAAANFGLRGPCLGPIAAPVDSA
jgi:hypothetical protein